jgi:hypothetical protein
MVYNIVLKCEAFAILDEDKSDVKFYYERALKTATGSLAASQ